jgi:pyrroline-5-carboxylate reductase
MSGSLWLIGAGNMGGAMLRGWLANGIDPKAVTIVEPFANNLPTGVTHHAELPDGGRPDILVLAIKPQQLSALAAAYRTRMAAAPRLLLSVLAGVETATLATNFGASAVIRAMPNLPAAIGQGATVLFSTVEDPLVQAEAGMLMTPLGLVEWIRNEDLFDAVTALSGSGPGYVFRFIEVLAEAGARLGLPADLAERLAIATVHGAAAMAGQGDASPHVLADRVASPGGTTREGLNILDDGDALKALIIRTLEAAARRSAELAAVSRG